MEKVTGASYTPKVYGVNTSKPDQDHWKKSFWPSMRAGMRNNPFTYTPAFVIPLVGSIIGWHLGNREIDKEVNPNNKATRVPNQFMIRITLDTIWDDEIVG